MIKIALSCGLNVSNEEYWEGSRRQVVNDAYIKAVLPGVQWHPEELAADHEEMARLFTCFTALCQKNV